MVSKQAANFLKSLFSDEHPAEKKQQEVYCRSLFMVLAGATRADLNVERAEVERVKQILESLLEREFSADEIQLAAETDLRDFAPIQKYIDRSSNVLSLQQRQAILYAMVEVFHSDGSMGVLETDYFNNIVNSLDLTPAQILKI